MIARLLPGLRTSLGALRDVFSEPGLAAAPVRLGRLDPRRVVVLVALAVFAYQEDGAFAVGLLGLVRWLTAAAVAPAAGILGDRYSRSS